MTHRAYPPHPHHVPTSAPALRGPSGSGRCALCPRSAIPLENVRMCIAPVFEPRPGGVMSAPRLLVSLRDGGSSVRVRGGTSIGRAGASRQRIDHRREESHASRQPRGSRTRAVAVAPVGRDSRGVADLSLTNTASPSRAGTTTLTYNLNVSITVPRSWHRRPGDDTLRRRHLGLATFNLLVEHRRRAPDDHDHLQPRTLTMGGGAAVSIVVRPQPG